MSVHTSAWQACPTPAGCAESVRSHSSSSCENSLFVVALDSCLTQLVISAGTRLSPKQVTHWLPAW
jgi:hypothetical protein